MNIIKQTYKRKLNKVGEYVEKIDGRKICCLDKTKLLKNKILKKTRIYDEIYDVVDIDCEALVKNIICDKDITYIFEDLYFDCKTRIYLSDLNLRYKNCVFEALTTMSANEMKCEHCTFMGDINIFANRIHMRGNKYKENDSQSRINMYAESTYLENERIDKKYDLNLSNQGQGIKKIEMKNCTINSGDITIWDSASFSGAVGNIDIMDTRIKTNSFETNLQALNLYFSAIEFSDLLKAENRLNFQKLSLFKSLIDSKNIIIACNKFESTDSVIISPVVDIKSKTSNLTNSNLISENMFIESDNLTIRNDKDNSIHADNGIYLVVKENADFNSKDIYSPFIIFNENVVSKNKEEESANLALIDPRNKLVDSLRRIRDNINNNINEMNKSIEDDLKKDCNVSDFINKKGLPKVKVIKK